MNDNKIYERLTEPFPSSAMKKIPHGPNLTTINAQYIRERLNLVFGVFGWNFSGEWQRLDQGVIFTGSLKIKRPGSDDVWHEVQAPGFSQLRKNNWGDAYKSAQTDALSKACSNIGIGNDVFKGEADEKQREYEYSNLGAVNKRPREAIKSKPNLAKKLTDKFMEITKDKTTEEKKALAKSYLKIDSFKEISGMTDSKLKALIASLDDMKIAISIPFEGA